jgi:protein with PEP-CTERM/exosortase system signal
MSLTNTFNGKSVIYLMGGAQCADLNVNGTFTVSDLMKSNSGTGFLSTHTKAGKTVADLSVGTPGNVSQFGDFDLTIDNFGGFTHSASTISFDLTATGGTTWATAKSVLFFNADDYDAAGHVFPSAFPAVASNNLYGSLTGFAGEFIGASTPDSGTTAALLGLAMIGLAAFRAKFRKA